MKKINLRTNKNNVLNDVYLITPEVFSDNRGFFLESWNEFIFNENIRSTNFCQDNHSYSSRGVLRGIHYQLNPHSQGKLVRCTRGCIYDVAVDLRKYSDTYKEWVGIELSEVNKKLLWIPEGFGHGFLTQSESAEVQYKVTNRWNKNSEKTIIWDDPDLKIDWPLSQLNIKRPLFSEKDGNGLTLESAEKYNFLF